MSDSSSKEYYRLLLAKLGILQFNGSDYRYSQLSTEDEEEFVGSVKQSKSQRRSSFAKNSLFPFPFWTSPVISSDNKAPVSEFEFDKEEALRDSSRYVLSLGYRKDKKLAGNSADNVPLLADGEMSDDEAELEPSGGQGLKDTAARNEAMETEEQEKAALPNRKRRTRIGARPTGLARNPSVTSRKDRFKFAYCNSGTARLHYLKKKYEEEAKKTQLAEDERSDIYDRVSNPGTHFAQESRHTNADEVEYTVVLGQGNQKVGPEGGRRETIGRDHGYSSSSARSMSTSSSAMSYGTDKQEYTDEIIYDEVRRPETAPPLSHPPQDEATDFKHAPPAERLRRASSEVECSEQPWQQTRAAEGDIQCTASDESTPRIPPPIPPPRMACVPQDQQESAPANSQEKSCNEIDCDQQVTTDENQSPDETTANKLDEKSLSLEEEGDIKEESVA